MSETRETPKPLRSYPFHMKRIKICSRCERPHGRKGRYCHDCHAAYMRDWRKKNPRLTDKAVERLRATA